MASGEYIPSPKHRPRIDTTTEGRIPVPPPSDEAYLAMKANPDYVEVIDEGHFMRRDTWERYQRFFPSVQQRAEILAQRREARRIAKEHASLVAQKRANIRFGSKARQGDVL